MTLDLFTPSDGLENLLPYDGCLHNHGLVLNLTEAQQAYAELLRHIDWRPDQLQMFGRTITTRRQVAWYADAGAHYRYSGSSKAPQPWTPYLLELKARVESHVGERFNACLLNHYWDGQDGMGWHSDDEAELGNQPIIASLSLGAERVFALRHKRTQDERRLPLASGQLIVMRGDTQHHWRHSLLKSRRIDAGRINLTFRTILRP